MRFFALRTNTLRILFILGLLGHITYIGLSRLATCPPVISGSIAEFFQSNQPAKSFDPSNSSNYMYIGTKYIAQSPRFLGLLTKAIFSVGS